MSRLPITRSRQAEEDLIDIWLYVAQTSTSAADRLLDRIESRCQQLGLQPYSGMSRNDLLPDVRHLVVGNFLVFHRVNQEDVLVLRVLDGRRNITAADFEI